jgi:predicted peptidase
MKKSSGLLIALAACGLLASCGGGGGSSHQTPAAALTSLSVEDSSHTGIQLSPSFDPSILEYTLEVQEDILGVKITPQAVPGATIAITSDINVDYHPGGNGAAHTPDPGDKSNFATGAWEAGQNWPNILFTDDSAIVRTIVNPAGIGAGPTGAWNDNGTYHSGRVTNANITVTKGSDTTTYTIAIHVADGTASYALFDQNEGAKTYVGSNGAKVPYNIYIPSDIKPGEKLPVIYALHGSGQLTQPVDMILKRYQMATVWAKDSATGHNRAIVLAPQATNWDFTNHANATLGYNGGLANWVNSESRVLNNIGDAAFELLQKLVNGTLPGYTNVLNHVDTNRIYITGLSMGGGGTLATLKAHPGYFAAAIPVCANLLLSASDAQAIHAANPGLQWYFIHAFDDPTVDIGYTKQNIAYLKAAGYNEASVKAEIYPTGTHFYESAHFSWVAGYQNSSIRNWLFAQSK